VAGRRVSVPETEDIHRILEPFGKLPDSSQGSRIQKYLAILLAWNQKLSLTSMDSAEEILSRQFGESLVAIEALPVEKGRLADVGTGAGFPGLALKIFAPSLEVTLIEQNLKKAAFLREAIRFLALEGVRVAATDYLSPKLEVQKFDWITAKALGRYEQVLSWATGWINASGQIVLWLGAEDSESIRRIPGWSWKKPIGVPQSKNRMILSGSPIPE